MKSCKLLTLVVPVFNEAESLPLLKEALLNWRRTFARSVEVILVNDGSTDDSLTMLRAWAAEDESVRVISFVRNFGHQAALLCGLNHANGDAVVIIDADLQDPLEVIPEMVKRFEEGYDIVYGRRVGREGETWFKRSTAWLFYRLMRVVAHRDLPADTGDFRLVSRACAKTVCAMKEEQPFLRGLFAWTGFPQCGVDYVRNPRKAGDTKYPLMKMVRFACNAALSFSLYPLRLIGILGVGMAGCGFLYGLYVVARWLIVQDTVKGWATLVVMGALLGGMNLIAIGIVGEYVGRIYEAVKGRPRYIVMEENDK